MRNLWFCGVGDGAALWGWGAGRVKISSLVSRERAVLGLGLAGFFKPWACTPDACRHLVDQANPFPILFSSSTHSPSPEWPAGIWTLHFLYRL